MFEYVRNCLETAWKDEDLLTRTPDIVFLVLDTQRADRLSCYGHPLATTPAIDTFAEDATLFRHAISPAQWTVPSHSSMFTGLYPSAHTTMQTFLKLPSHLSTLAERLRDSGYHTAAFCNNPLVGVINNGLRRGFVSFLNYSGLMTSHPNQAGVRSGPIDIYRQFFKRVLAGLLNKIQDSFAHSERLLDFSFTPLMVPIWQTALSFKGNTARSLNDAARLLIERPNLPADRPIFSFINLMGVHMPHHPPHAAIERFAPRVLQDKEARRYLRRYNTDIYGWLAPLTRSVDVEHKELIDGMYNAEVYNQDILVGKFIQRLRESGTLDNTLFIIVADHGDHLGEKQLMGHSFSVYNELVHVPLIIRDPAGDLPRGATVDQTISTRRLFHTVLTAAQQATAAEETLTLARPTADDPEQEIVFSEGVPPQNLVNLLQRRDPNLVATRRCDLPRRAIWQDGYKLIMTGEGLTSELYHVPDDPTEQQDLSTTQSDQVALLQNRLESFVSQQQQHASSATRIEEEADAALSRRLRDLGYIE